MAVQKGNNIFTVRGEGRMTAHQALSLMGQGKIRADDLITHRFPLAEINRAGHRNLCGKTGQCNQGGGTPLTK